MTSVLSYNAAFTAHTKPTTGDIKSSFVSVDHLGWLNCNGRYLSTVTYNLLFQVIGYTYGRSGNDFRLPNMGGRVIGSEGTIVEPSGTYNFPSGYYADGEVKHKLLVAEMPSHNHDTTTPTPVAPPAAGNTSLAYTNIIVNLGPSGVTTAPHAHTSNATGGQGGQGLCIATGTGTAVSTDASDGELNVWTLPRALTINDTTVTIIEPNGGAGHNHTITDPGHRHTISSNGGDQYHNNMQPTIFYGNTFVYCGIPTTTNLVQANPNWQNSWPYAVPQSNPPLL